VVKGIINRNLCSALEEQISKVSVVMSIDLFPRYNKLSVSKVDFRLHLEHKKVNFMPCLYKILLWSWENDEHSIQMMDYFLKTGVGTLIWWVLIYHVRTLASCLPDFIYETGIVTFWKIRMKSLDISMLHPSEGVKQDQIDYW
jgi:hypothetical protein